MACMRPVKLSCLASALSRASSSAVAEAHEPGLADGGEQRRPIREVAIGGHPRHADACTDLAEGERGHALLWISSRPASMSACRRLPWWYWRLTWAPRDGRRAASGRRGAGEGRRTGTTPLSRTCVDIVNISRYTPLIDVDCVHIRGLHRASDTASLRRK